MNLDYFKRDIYDALLKWKNNKTRTALEIVGARQVGKTFIVEKFAKENFKHVIYINLFDRNSRIITKKLENSYVVGYRELLQELSPDFVDDEDSVVIIDEVQESSHIYNIIHSVVNSMKVNLILLGSFLGGAMTFIDSTDLTQLVMRSLSFPEFLDIFNMRELYNELDLYGASPHDNYDKIKQFYNLYLITGGYPSVIKEALLSVELNSAKIRRILEIFCDDASRHFDKIEDVEALPFTLDNLADFILKGEHVVGESGQGEQRLMHKCISWLLRCQLLARWDTLSRLDKASFKIRYYFEDVGLANYLYTKSNLDKLQQNDRLAENFVYRSLLDNKALGNYMAYFDLQGELDSFEFVSGSKKVYKVAVEIKSQQGIVGEALTLLEEGKVDYLIQTNADTYGGKIDNLLLIPIYLFGRFHMDEVIALEEGCSEDTHKP